MASSALLFPLTSLSSLQHRDEASYVLKTKDLKSTLKFGRYLLQCYILESSKHPTSTSAKIHKHQHRSIPYEFFRMESCLNSLSFCPYKVMPRAPRHSRSQGFAAYPPGERLENPQVGKAGIQLFTVACQNTFS